MNRKTLLLISLLLLPSSLAAQKRLYYHSYPGDGSAFLGVQIRDAERADLDSLQLTQELGVVIEGVEADSPAAQADLQEGDIILEYAGLPVLGARHFQRLVAETPPGRRISLRIGRSGQLLEKSVQLGERSPWERRSFRFEVPAPFLGDRVLPQPPEPFALVTPRPRLGVRVVELTEQLADHLGVPQGQGLLITEVRPDTPASAAGLQAGDVITQVDGQAVRRPHDLSRRLQEGDEHELSIVRNKQTMKVPLRFGQGSPSPKSRRQRL